MIKIQNNVTLSPFTTLGIGGPAKHFVQVFSKEDLREAISWAKENDEKFFILSGGSNVLFSDKGFNGLVIKLSLDGVVIKSKLKRVEAQAGAHLSEVVMSSCKAGLTGMENMYGIPGSVGGAVRGNAGAFGTEIKDVLSEAVAINTETNKVKTFSNKECEFAYRESFFKKNSEWVILEATFFLCGKEARACVARACNILKARNEAQIQSVRSAGSYFKNPIATKEICKIFEEEKREKARKNRVPAGWLIDRLGFKGVRKGGAQVSKNRANYIINAEGATSADVLSLADKIKEKVKREFNLNLEEEVQIVDF